MSRIIFATDFSPVAQNAATYAAQLAIQLGCDLSLFHAYVVPFAYTDTSIPFLNANEILSIADTNMEIERKRLQDLQPNLFIQTKSVPGDLISCLKEEIEEQKPKLIVMGTSGGDEDSVLWGSLAVRALRAFKIPVLTIPAKASWRPIKKMAFAADYRTVSERTPVDKILNWAHEMAANLVVVHIDNTSTETYNPPDMLIKNLASINPSYHSVSTEGIVDGVHNFVQNNEVDWLVLIPRKFGFWKSLFFKSKTKMLTQISETPILSIHED